MEKHTNYILYINVLTTNKIVIYGHIQIIRQYFKKDGKYNATDFLILLCQNKQNQKRVDLQNFTKEHVPVEPALPAAISIVEANYDYITLNVPPVAFSNVPLQTWSHSVRQS